MATGMATRVKVWTLKELHSLPDDGNKYELVRGELFVTPAPTDEHETIAARLTRLLDPYVAANGLGFIYRPRAVMQFRGSEVEPDLMVRQPHPRPRAGWAKAPKPLLIVEIISDSTRGRDRNQKKSFYMEAGVPEYWIVDPESRTITVVRPHEADHEESKRLSWEAAGVAEPLVIRVADVFA